MKVLFITNNFLDGNGGGSFASRAYINAFSEVADECMLLYPDNGKDLRPYIHETVKLYGVPDRKNKFTKLIDFYIGKINRYSNVIIPILNSFKPDTVVFDKSHSSAGLIKIVKAFGIKTITIHHNYEVEYYEGTKPPFLIRLPFLYYMKNAEKEAVQLSDLNLTLTNQDTELLRLNYDLLNKVAIRRLGCFESSESPQRVSGDCRSYHGTHDTHDKKSFKYAITGSLSAYQTEVSIIPFLEDFFPLILKKDPGSKLVIAGRNPSEKLRNACEKYALSISLISNPVSIQDVISEVDIYICPVSVGGGLKLRVMDGLKAGLPVVTHMVSARGYDDFRNAGHLLVYDDKYSFEQSLDLLLSERFNISSHNIDIQKLYRSIFSFNSGVNRLRNLLFEYKLVHQIVDRDEMTLNCKSGM